jgi:lipoprotein-anchoring transpeptidase ErfK/SrfK
MVRLITMLSRRSPRAAGTFAIAALATVVLSSCGLGSSAAQHGTSPGADEATTRAAKVTIAPADQSQNVPLDSPVQVSVTSGRLASVTLQEDGGGAVEGAMADGNQAWTYASGLDSNAHYTVTAVATGTNGKRTTVQAAFGTLTAQDKLTTDVSPSDGDTVGVGEPIMLHFNNDIPDSRKAALLERIQVQSTPGVLGAWHWVDASDVHFRTQNYWPVGTKVSVNATLNGFNAGNGVWGLGNWSESFTVGNKHVSTVDNNSHQMNVYENDKLIDTWPVSMGKQGFETIQGTLFVRYKLYKVKMQSCQTFGGAACVPGAENYYNDYVYYDTAISTTGFYIHSAPWDLGDQGVDNVSHGCVNLSPERATTFYNWSLPGDIVIITNTGNDATYASGEGDWQLNFAQYNNTAGVGNVWTGAGGAEGRPGQV